MHEFGGARSEERLRREIRDQRSQVRLQKTEDRRQKTEDSRLQDDLVPTEVSRFAEATARQGGQRLGL